MLIPKEDVLACMRKYNIDLTGAFHIGAHECEELTTYQYLGIPDERVVWIEALPDKVDEAVMRGVPNVFQAVISDEDDETVIFKRTNNGQSSSILEFGTHEQHYAWCVVTERMTMTTTTIDTFMTRNNLNPANYDFWNMDIQGAELKALNGGECALKHAKVLYLEVNSEEVYKGGALIGEIDDFLRKRGFGRVSTQMVPQGWGDAMYVRIPCYTVHLMGGLGNQLFQLAFLEYIQRTTGGRAFLAHLNSPVAHSNERYFDTIFREWQAMYDASIPTPRIVHESHSMCAQTWDVGGGACYFGYFQRHEYTDLIRDSFCAKLHFDQGVLQRHPGLSRKTFIHVRGGDYKTIELHAIPLAAYYARCMDLTPLKEFVIFTNDTPLTMSMFPGFPIVTESEVDTLFLMSQCGACICANSSFSWWGAYLNPTRPIFMPARWYNGDDTRGSYYFEGVTVVDV